VRETRDVTRSRELARLIACVFALLALLPLAFLHNGGPLIATACATLILVAASHG
jgi:hypothetical protein